MKLDPPAKEPPMIEVDFVITDEMIRESVRRNEQQKLTRANRFVIDIIKVLAGYPAGLRRQLVLELVWSNRTKLGLEINPTFNQTVQAALQFHCKDSDEFKKRGVPESEALFWWPRGKNAGYWALLRENAKRWLIAQGYLVS